jgi:hypothetical protein
LNISYSKLMEIAGYLESKEPSSEDVKVPVNLRRFLRENELMFDGVLLTEQDKEWIERMITVLFWKEKHSKPKDEPAGVEDSPQ